MKNGIRRSFTILAAIALLCSAALADSISFTGSVAAGSSCQVYAPIGGTVASVEVEAGQQVSAGDVIATLATEKVYAEEDGVVTGLFGQPGDSAETVSQKYGAVMYIEGASKYSIAASTEEAYNKTANKFVQVGEQVLLSCYSGCGHSGKGVITAIEGIDFTVEVTEGSFLVGETVSVFRGSVASSNRIGRGDITRKSPTAVSASGSIVSIAVENGDAVQRGDLLMETLSGSFDGLYMSGSKIIAPEDGVISGLNLAQGEKIEKGAVAAEIYPADSMRIVGKVQEANLSLIAAGDPVEIELIWNQDAEVTYTGVVRMISSLAAEAQGEDSDVYYDVYVDFTPDADTRYGMSAIVSTVEAVLPDLMEDKDAEAE